MKRLWFDCSRRWYVLLAIATLAALHCTLILASQRNQQSEYESYYFPQPAKSPQEPKGKLPEPDKDAVLKAERILNKTFKDEFAKAKTEPAAARALAEILLREASRTNDDPPLRYIALCNARDLAATAGDIANAMTAIEELARHYTIDSLTTKAKMLALAADKVTSKEDQHAIVEAALAVLHQAVANDSYPAAEELIKAAQQSAAKLQNQQIASQVDKLGQEMQHAKTEYARMQKFINILAKEPGDAAANAEMGKYYCLVKGNWERGLPMLVKGGDKTFLELAKRDLANPKDTRGQLDLGDDYSTLAENEKGLTQKMLLKRALHWYSLCLPNLEGGLNRLRVERAVDEISKLLPPTPTLTGSANVPITTLLRTFDATGHFNGIQTLAISPDNKLVVSGGIKEAIVRLWDVASGKKTKELLGHKDEIWAVAFSVDGTLCASASSDKTVRTWEVATANTVRTFQGHNDWVRGVSFLPDKARILTASDDYSLRIWDLKDGTVKKTLVGHSNYINSLSVSKDGKRAVTGSEDNTARVWDLDKGLEIARFSHDRVVVAAALSPDGKKVVTATASNVCKLWDVDGKKELATLSVPTRAWAIAFAPSGRMVAIGTGGVAMVDPQVNIDGGWAKVGAIDNSVYFWDIDTAKPMRRLTGHTGSVLALAFSNDGRYLVSGGEDKVIRLWGEGKK